jgi:hypothetical protein
MVALVLTMSLTAFAVILLVYLAFLAFGAPWRRRLVLKLLLLMVATVIVYSVVFPGLFDTNISDSKFSVSLLTRGLDLAGALGLTNVLELFADQREKFSASLQLLDESSYSLYSQVLRSAIAIPLSIGAVLGAIAYRKSIKRMAVETGRAKTVYIAMFASCMLTQAGVNYMQAPAFQIILGLALFPVFGKLWSPAPAVLTRAVDNRSGTTR